MGGRVDGWMGRCVVVYPVNIGQPLHSNNYQLVYKQGCKEVSCLNSQMNRCGSVGVGRQVDLWVWVL